MKLCTTVSRNTGKRFYHFNCGFHLRYGKLYCFSHYIAASILEEIVLEDIREMARRIVLDEEAICEEYIRHNSELADKTINSAKKELQLKRKHSEEITRLIRVALPLRWRQEHKTNETKFIGNGGCRCQRSQKNYCVRIKKVEQRKKPSCSSARLSNLEYVIIFSNNFLR